MQVSMDKNEEELLHFLHGMYDGLYGDFSRFSSVLSIETHQVVVFCGWTVSKRACENMRTPSFDNDLSET